MTDLFSLSACYKGLGLAPLRLISQMRCLHLFRGHKSEAPRGAAAIVIGYIPQDHTLLNIRKKGQYSSFSSPQSLSIQRI